MDFNNHFFYIFYQFQAAYTFDAGPNATIYLLEKDVAELISIIDYYFPPNNDIHIEYHKGVPVDIKVPTRVNFFCTELFDSMHF